MYMYDIRQLITVYSGKFQGNKILLFSRINVELREIVIIH